MTVTVIVTVTVTGYRDKRFGLFVYIFIFTTPAVCYGVDAYLAMSVVTSHDNPPTSTGKSELLGSKLRLVLINGYFRKPFLTHTATTN